MIDIASLIDHTLLKPEATAAEIKQLCEEAKTYGFASVCINSVFLPVAYPLLKDSSVKLCTVVGFPLGANTTSVKVFEAQKAIQDGAQEIDMVMRIGALTENKYEEVVEDIRAVVEAAEGQSVKVIIETCLLTNEEIKMACKASLEAGAHFVKTSTGFSTGGAKVEHVRLMNKVVRGQMEVKASGGIRDLKTAQAMVEAGATRIGTSNGVNIIKELQL